MEIIELELQTRHPDKLKHFYTETLGFNMLDDRQNAGFALAIGAARLYFTVNADRAEGSYHFAFRVPYHQFEKVSQWLQQKVTILPDPQTKHPVIVHEEWEAKAVYFLDPEGNILEFIAHKSIKDNEQATLGNGVVSICEIGLAVPQVPAFADALKQNFGLKRWKTGYEKFEAVGDAHALFILAEEGRNWFPTKLAAAALPVRVLVKAPAQGNISKYTFSVQTASEHTLAS